MAAIPVEATSTGVAVNDAVVRGSLLVTGGNSSGAATVWTSPAPPVAAEPPVVAACVKRPALIDLIENPDPAHCYGKRSITFRALPASFEGDPGPPDLAPRWLAHLFGLFLHPIPGSNVRSFEVSGSRPRTSTRRPSAGTSSSSRGS
jgi:hypothetical protein